MRTIHVVYTNKKLTYSESERLNEYKFLCSNDKIKTGDLISSPDYSTNMQVVAISNNTLVHQNGIALKEINISHVNGVEIVNDSPKPINLITKRIDVSIDQAISWYRSGDKALKDLALSLFSEEEMEQCYDYIERGIKTTSICVEIPHLYTEQPRLQAKLAIIAKFFNKGWAKTTENTGYFIGKKKNSSSNDEICIMSHQTVVYSGIVYFQQIEHAQRALDILGGSSIYHLLF